MAALTDVQICNLAQFKLGSAEQVSDISAPRNPAERSYALIYPHYRDVELRARRWRFAMASDVQLTRLSGDSGDWKRPNIFALPTNCLRAVRDNFDRWEQVGDVLHSDESELRLDYIRNDIEPGKFDPNFVDVLASRMAYERCEKATQSNTKKQDLWAMRLEALKVAGQINAFITGPEQIDADDRQYSWLVERAI